jgi:hypothetical protein
MQNGLMQVLEFRMRRISHKNSLATSLGEIVGRVGDFLRDIQHASHEMRCRAGLHLSAAVEISGQGKRAKRR